tara:strand:+ start:3192 stop:3368 length:177 start_codon:yes stop_codon:yes gene_type:complete
MGIRINMENKLDNLEKRVVLLEGAIEDLLDIYKENKDGKKKETTKKVSKKKAVSKEAK